MHWPPVILALDTIAGAETIQKTLRGFSCPVFPALGTFVRLAALPESFFPLLVSLLTITTLSIHAWAAARGQMSPTWDFPSPFVIVQPDDWCVCLCVCERAGDGERE